MTESRNHTQQTNDRRHVSTHSKLIVEARKHALQTNRDTGNARFGGMEKLIISSGDVVTPKLLLKFLCLSGRKRSENCQTYAPNF